MRATIRSACVTTLLLAASIGSARAGVITYGLAELGGGQWRYDYEVTNDDLEDPVTGFTVFFALGSYAALFVPDVPAGLCGSSSMAPENWQACIAQPDPELPDNGFLDLTTTGPGIALGETLGGFSIEFQWLGATAPGGQPFDFTGLQFDADEGMDVLVVRQSGVTEPRTPVSVPEPGTLPLLALALVGIAGAGARRHRRASSIRAEA